MDVYPLFWGIIKYLLPAMFLVVSLWVIPNILLLMVSIIWILATITVNVLYMEESKPRRDFSGR
ncbi:MAG: hypothetical protein M1533_02525 [Candidatus Thermoplasmatota archaeon]|nr:hypothetical protein [Candidatus Thermoplasmatota archaeon]MCL5793426.1 hypothetical protein [Candidatus Thermoplasmatota archaeon]